MNPRDQHPSMLARIFGQGESVMWWGLPVGSVGRVQLRVHLVYPTLILAQLGYAMWMGTGVAFVALSVLGLLLSVCVHEIGRWGCDRLLLRSLKTAENDEQHGADARHRVGSSEVCLWPMGGIWRFNHAVTPAIEGRAALGAWCVSCLQCLVLALVVWLMTGDWRVVAFDLLRPDLVLGDGVLSTPSTAVTLLRIGLWEWYAMGVYLLLINMLPIVPLDGGQVLRWRWSIGRSLQEADIFAAQVGLLLTMVLFVVSMVTQRLMLGGLAVFLGVMCLTELQAARFSIDPAGLDRWRGVFERSAGGTATGTRTADPAQDGGRFSEADRQKVEAILAKISTYGMASLNRAERRILKRATRQLRND